MDEADILSRLKGLEERVKNLEHVTATITELLQKVAVIDTKIDMMTQQIGTLSSRLTEIEKLPADKWGTVVKTTLTVVLSAAVGYVISMFIPK